MKINLFIIIITLFISSCGNDNILEKDYELDFDPNNEINLVISKDGYQLIKIPGHILFYGHNKDYILLNQKPSDSIYSIEDNLNLQQKMGNIYKTEFNKYWIITLSNDSIHGPLDKKMYLSLRKEMNIPVNIKLDNSTLEFFGKGKRKDIEYSNIDSITIDVENLKGNQFYN
jgi:hypothetical protein